MSYGRLIRGSKQSAMQLHIFIVNVNSTSSKYVLRWIWFFRYILLAIFIRMQNVCFIDSITMQPINWIEFVERKKNARVKWI